MPMSLAMFLTHSTDGVKAETPPNVLFLTPRDHVPRAEAIGRQKALYGQAKSAAEKVRDTIRRLPRGVLPRSAAEVMEVMVLMDLRASIRREPTYRPTRKRIAAATGYSERTVSDALSRLAAAGLIEVACYGRGGRDGHRGHGLATEFRAGRVMAALDRLIAMGAKLAAGAIRGLRDLAAAVVAEPRRAGFRHRKPTGKQLPGILESMKGSLPRPALGPLLAMLMGVPEASPGAVPARAKGRTG